MARPPAARLVPDAVASLVGIFAAPEVPQVGVLVASDDLGRAAARTLAAAGWGVRLEVVGPDEAIAGALSRLCSGQPPLDALACEVGRAAEVVEALPAAEPRPALVVLSGAGSSLGDLVLAAHARGYRAAAAQDALLLLFAAERPDVAAALSGRSRASGSNSAPEPEGATWRALALAGWSDAAEQALTARPEDRRIEALEQEIVALRTSTSWRVTRPLRVVARRRER